MKISMPGKLVVAGLLLVAAALVAVHVLKDDAARSLVRTIESRGSRVLGTRVAVSHAKLDRRAAHILLSGLAVANPPGFDRRNMIRVGEIDVQLDRKGRIVKQVDLRGIQALIEFRGARSNIEALTERVARGRAVAGSEATETNGAPSQGGRALDKGEQSKAARDDWRVQRIEFRGSRVSVRADWTSKVFELQTDGFSVGPLNAGTDDLVRTVVTRFVDKVLVTAARGVDDPRVSKVLMDKLTELRARLERS